MFNDDDTKLKNKFDNLPMGEVNQEGESNFDFLPTPLKKLGGKYQGLNE